MAQQLSSVEIANVAPTLRDDLRFTLQKHGGETCYMLEDPLNVRFFRVGVSEYVFLSLLDGATTIKEAVALTAKKLGRSAFTEREAAAICKWIVDNQLAHTGASQQVDRLVDVKRRRTVSRRMQWINPILLRLPLLKPDSTVDWFTKHFGWLISRPAFAVWIVVCAIAVFQLLTHWDEFHASSHNVLSAGNRWWLLATWIILKVVHESAHAITCKKYGGEVHEAGLMLIVFAPIPFVDVTSSWRFPSKWQRIYTAAAGMYAELFCAAVATIIWFYVDDVIVRQVAHNVMFTATLMTLLFNANFLMRFDGYYILSDLVEIPNLYPLGQQFTRYLGAKVFLGSKQPLPRWPATKSAVIKTYGVVAFFWRIFVFTSIVITASTLLSGAGILLALVAIGLWLGFPIHRCVKQLFDTHSYATLNLVRCLCVSALIVIGVIGFLMLPEPGGVRAPAVVRFAPLHVVRAPHHGFVRNVAIGGGDTVMLGQAVADVENIDLVAEAEDLRLAIIQSELRTRFFQDEDRTAAAQAENKSRQVLITEYQQRCEQLSRSKLSAPAQGRVMTPDAHLMLGKYLEEGDEVISIGNESSKRIEMSIAQDDVEFFRRFVGRDVKAVLRSPGYEPIKCQLIRVEPRGSQTLNHAALAASAGGLLPVQVVQVDSDTATQDAVEEWEFLQPRFVGIAQLSLEQSAKLRAGQTATVRLNASRGTVGQLLYRTVSDWVRRQVETRLG